MKQDELIVNIGAKLCWRIVGSLCTPVCKRWYVSLSSDVLWARFLEAEFPTVRAACGYSTHAQREPPDGMSKASAGPVSPSITSFRNRHRRQIDAVFGELQTGWDWVRARLTADEIASDSVGRCRQVVQKLVRRNWTPVYESVALVITGALAMSACVKSRPAFSLFYHPYYSCVGHVRLPPVAHVSPVLRFLPITALGCQRQAAVQHFQMPRLKADIARVCVGRAYGSACEASLAGRGGCGRGGGAADTCRVAGRGGRSTRESRGCWDSVHFVAGGFAAECRGRLAPGESVASWCQQVWRAACSRACVGREVPALCPILGHCVLFRRVSDTQLAGIGWH